MEIHRAVGFIEEGEVLSINNSGNILQQLNTISTPGGIGLPVSSYASAMQEALTQQLTKAPNAELSQLNSQQSALTALQSALNTFQQATQTLASSQNWNSVTAASSDPTAFSATTSAGAQASNYNIQVTELAQTQSDILQTSSLPSSASTAMNMSGTLVITPNSSGSATTINVTTSESLNDIVNAVNADTSTTGVQAQVLYNGTGYMLALSAINSGTTSGYSLSGSSLITSSATSTTFSDTETAPQNATILLDGQTFTSSTNTFDKAIPDVTLNVFQTTSSSSTNTLSITNNSSSTIQAVQTWMNAYNSLVDLLHQDTAFSSSTNSSGATTTNSGPLFTDFNANSLLSQLPSALNNMISSTGNSAINSLASIGIVVDPNNGHLEFQSSSGFSVGTSSFSGSLQDGETMFENALASNANAVKNVFGVVGNNSISTAVPNSGILGDVNNTLNNFLVGQGNQPSAFQSDLNSISDQQTNINTYLTQINNQISQTVANFTAQLDQLNAAMQQSQAQMQQLSAMFGGASGSSTSTSASSTSSSTGL